MVKILPGNGVVNLESTLEITEGKLAIIKANKNKVDALCRDLSISHTYYQTEEGNIISKIGCSIKDAANAAFVVKKLKEKHVSLLREVDKWAVEDEKTNNSPEEEPEGEFFMLRRKGNEIEFSGNIHPAEVAGIIEAAMFVKMMTDANS